MFVLKHKRTKKYYKESDLDSHSAKVLGSSDITYTKDINNATKFETFNAAWEITISYHFLKPIYIE